MPIGDSITEGAHTSNVTYVPNYRIPLWTRLEAIGYDVTSAGWLESNPYNGADVLAPEKWRSHSGRGGAELCWYPCASGQLRGAVRESIEALLDQAGVPDIITLKIGTNDLGHENIPAEDYLVSLTNVLWRIHAYRPTTKVVLSTLLDLNVGGTEYDSANCSNCVAKIRGLFAEGNGYGFPANFLFLSDAYDRVPRYVGTTYQGTFLASGNVHPNWKGHDMFADVWFEAVTNALAAAPLEGTVVTNTLSGAVNNVPAAYREGFTQAATLTLNPNFYIARGTAPTYTTVADDTAGLIAKTAYYFELKRKGSDHRRWVWVDFDSFGAHTFAANGFPANYAYTGRARKFHIISNDPAVHTVAPDDDSVEGWLQLYPYKYGGAASGLVGAPADNHGAIDWNDTVSTGGGRGRFNVSRIFKPGESVNPAEIVFAYNNWAASASVTNEVGIGNFAQHVAGNTIDYTNIDGRSTTGSNATSLKSMSGSAYEVINLEIWTKRYAEGEGPEYVWSGEGTNDNWTTSANWGDTVGYPGFIADSTAVFTNMTAAATARVDLATIAVDAIRLPDIARNDATAPVTLTGGNTLLVDDFYIGTNRHVVVDGLVITNGTFTLRHSGSYTELTNSVHVVTNTASIDSGANAFTIDSASFIDLADSAFSCKCRASMLGEGTITAKSLNMTAAKTTLSTKFTLDLTETQSDASMLKFLTNIVYVSDKEMKIADSDDSTKEYDVTPYYVFGWDSDNNTTKMILSTNVAATVTSENATNFSLRVNTIPGMYYALAYGDEPGSTAVTNSFSQAKAANTDMSLDGMSFGDGDRVKYIKILTRDSL